MNLHTQLHNETIGTALVRFLKPCPYILDVRGVQKSILSWIVEFDGYEGQVKKLNNAENAEKDVKFLNSEKSTLTNQKFYQEDKKENSAFSIFLFWL